MFSFHTIRLSSHDRGQRNRLSCGHRNTLSLSWLIMVAHFGRDELVKAGAAVSLLVKIESVLFFQLAETLEHHLLESLSLSLCV